MKELEDMCSIFERIDMRIDFVQIQQKKEILFKYLFRTSDMFSLIVNKYVDMDSVDSQLKNKLTTYLVGEISDNSQWLPHISKQKDEIMYVFKCCSATRKIMIENFNIWWNNVEGCYSDIGFYRSNHLWFYCVDHEMLAFVNAHEDDIVFLDQNSIKHIGDNSDINYNSKNYSLVL